MDIFELEEKILNSEILKRPDILIIATKIKEDNLKEDINETLELHLAIHTLYNLANNDLLRKNDKLNLVESELQLEIRNKFNEANKPTEKAIWSLVVSDERYQKLLEEIAECKRKVFFLKGLEETIKNKISLIESLLKYGEAK